MALDNNEVLRLQRIIYDISGAASDFAKSVRTISEAQNNQGQNTVNLGNKSKAAADQLGAFKSAIETATKSSKTANALLGEQLKTLNRSIEAEKRQQESIKTITDAYNTGANSVNNYVSHTVSALTRSNAKISSSWKSITDNTANAVNDQFKQFGSVVDAQQYQKAFAEFNTAMGLSGNNITRANMSIVRAFVDAGTAIGETTTEFHHVRENLAKAVRENNDVSVDPANITAIDATVTALATGTQSVVDRLLTLNTALSSMTVNTSTVGNALTEIQTYQEDYAALLSSLGPYGGQFQDELQELTKTLDGAKLEQAKTAFLTKLQSTSGIIDKQDASGRNTDIFKALTELLRVGRNADGTAKVQGKWFEELVKVNNQLTNGMTGVSSVNVYDSVTEDAVKNLLAAQVGFVTDIKNSFSQVHADILNEAVAATASQLGRDHVSVLTAVENYAAQSISAFEANGARVLSEAAKTFADGSEVELQNTVVALVREALVGSNNQADELKSYEQLKYIGDYNQYMAQLTEKLLSTNQILGKEDTKLLQNLIKSGKDSGITDSAMLDALADIQAKVATGIDVKVADSVTNKLTESQAQLSDAFSRTAVDLEGYNKGQGKALATLRSSNTATGKMLAELAAIKRNNGSISGGDVRGAVETAGGGDAIAKEVLGAVGTMVKAVYVFAKDVSKFTSTEYDAFVSNNIQLDRTATGSTNATKLDLGEADFMKVFSDYKTAWVNEGVGAITQQMQATHDQYERVYGTDPQVIAKNQLAFKQLSQITGLTTDQIADMQHSMKQMSTVVGLSTQEMTDMTMNISKDAAFRSTLQKMNSADRAARVMQIQKQVEFAAALGMSKEATEEFAKAVLTVGEGLSPEEILGDVGGITNFVATLTQAGQQVGVSAIDYGLSADKMNAYNDALMINASARTEEQNKLVAETGTQIAKFKNDIEQAQNEQIKGLATPEEKKTASQQFAGINTVAKMSEAKLSDALKKTIEVPASQQLEQESALNRMKNGASIEEVKAQGEALQKAQEPAYLEAEKTLADTLNHISALFDGLAGAVATAVAALVLGGGALQKGVGLARAAGTAATAIEGAGMLTMAGEAIAGIGTMVAGAVSSPVVLGALGAAAVGYAGYEAYKYFSDDDKSEGTAKPAADANKQTAVQITPEEPKKLPSTQITESLSNEISATIADVGKQLLTFLGSVPGDVTNTAASNAALLEVMSNWVKSQSNLTPVPVITPQPNVTR
jgi:hypothetical protein